MQENRGMHLYIYTNKIFVQDLMYVYRSPIEYEVEMAYPAAAHWSRIIVTYIEDEISVEDGSKHSLFSYVYVDIDSEKQKERVCCSSPKHICACTLTRSYITCTSAHT